MWSEVSTYSLNSLYKLWEAKTLFKCFANAKGPLLRIRLQLFICILFYIFNSATVKKKKKKWSTDFCCQHPELNDNVDPLLNVSVDWMGGSAHSKCCIATERKAPKKPHFFFLLPKQIASLFIVAFFNLNFSKLVLGHQRCTSPIMLF